MRGLSVTLSSHNNGVSKCSMSAPHWSPLPNQLSKYLHSRSFENAMCVPSSIGLILAHVYRPTTGISLGSPNGISVFAQKMKHPRQGLN